MRNVFYMTDLNDENNAIKTINVSYNNNEDKPSYELQKTLEEAEYIKEHPSKYESYDNINDLFNKLDSDN